MLNIIAPYNKILYNITIKIYRSSHIHWTKLLPHLASTLQKFIILELEVNEISKICTTVYDKNKKADKYTRQLQDKAPNRSFHRSGAKNESMTKLSHSAENLRQPLTKKTSNNKNYD